MNFEFIEPVSDSLTEMPVEEAKIPIKTEPNPLLVQVDASHYGELLSAAEYKKPIIYSKSESIPTDVTVFIKTEPLPSPEHISEEPSRTNEEYTDIVNDNRNYFTQDSTIKIEPFLDESNNDQSSETKINVNKKPAASKRTTKSKKRSKTMVKMPTIKMYECETCRKVFTKRNSFIKHLRIHLPQTKTYQCAHCEYVCHCRNAVRKHMWIHMKEKLFQCYLCRVSIESKKQMKEHMIVEHCDGEQFVQICCFCSETYKTRKEVEEHENRQHRMERLKCITCKKEFKSLTGLRGHIERFHTNNLMKRPEPVPCTICQKILSSKSALREHLKRHDVKRPFICDTCGDSFKFPTCLKIHQRIHTGEKPFKCSYCENYFAHEGTRRKHEMIHKGVIPHRCTFGGCDKAFRNVSDLKAHVQIHTKNWKFRCQICAQGYARSGDFKRHLDRHKNTEISK